MAPRFKQWNGLGDEPLRDISIPDGRSEHPLTVFGRFDCGARIFALVIPPPNEVVSRVPQDLQALL